METDLAASQESLVQPRGFPWGSIPQQTPPVFCFPRGGVTWLKWGCDCPHSAWEQTDGSKGCEQAEATVAGAFRSPSILAFQGPLTSPQGG